MLNIYSSNRLEDLAAELARQLRSDGHPVLAPRQIITLNAAMSRWLNVQLCQHNGVVANMAYPLPAAWLWQLAHDCLGDLPVEDPLSRQHMTWRIYGELPTLLERTDFQTLADYLRNDPEGLRRWQLAALVADVFDRYQFYRPADIRRWSRGDTSDDWQAHLWRTISDRTPHRIQVIDRLLQLLDEQPPAGTVPRRIDLFAVHALPPLFIQLLGRLAQYVDVQLWSIAPTEHYWGDLKSSRAIARRRLDNPQEAALWETGNQLLASWGRHGQAMQDLLLELSDDLSTGFAEHDLSTAPQPDNLLGCLQADIFELRGDGSLPASRQVVQDDDQSLSISVAHSAMRECQVLHDRLLDQLLDDELRPEDILVLVPEISRYAPYIEAVFSKNEDGERPFIPWNISDITIADEHPLTRSFLALLGLPDSRFTRSEVLSFLDLPEIRDSFDLSADDAEQVRTWLDDTHVFWGLDGRHKQAAGLPDMDDNTWQQAGDRLFTGYALGDDDLYDDIAPYPAASGAAAATLGRFWHLLDKLRDWARRLAERRPANDWSVQLHALLGDFLGERNDDDGRVLRLREAIADFAEQSIALDEPLGPLLVRRWFEQALDSDTAVTHAYSGGVTFSGMRPMRSVPFKVVCLLGMQDGAFPRTGLAADFDRMQDGWQHGDPHSGHEDRYLFLESLLAARQTLYVSYTGRDNKTNNALQPSILLQELLDYIDRYYCAPDGERLSKRIIREYPLQPFSVRSYGDTNGLPRSYDRWWCQVAAGVLQSRVAHGQKPPWPELRLDELPESARDISIDGLVSCLANPVKAFVNRRLRIWLDDPREDIDDEPFALDALIGYELKSELLDDLLDDRQPVIASWRATGILPHGALGQHEFSNQQQVVSQVHKRLRPILPASREQHDIELSLGADDGQCWNLSGRLQGVAAGDGIVCCRPANLKGKDILAMWIQHLALIASDVRTGQTTSHHVASDETFSVSTDFDSTTARIYLARLAALYWQALHRPLPLPARTTHVWASTYLAQLGKNKSSDHARQAADKKAGKTWSGDAFNFHGAGPERDDPYQQLVTRGTMASPLESSGFSAQALDLYRPAYDHRVPSA